MESNIPVAGKEPVEEEAQTTPAPHDEATNGTSPQPPAEASVTDAQPDPVAETESTAPVDVQAQQPPVEEAVAAEPEAQPSPEAEVESDAPVAQDKPGLKKGDIIEGTVTETSPTEIYIALAEGKTGVVSGKELERMDREMLEALKEGESVTVYVLVPENRHGNVVLSLTRALEEQDWQHAEALRESGEIFHGNVDGYNKGGLIVRFGRVRGFVPESQASRERRMRASGSDPQEKWGEMRGEDIVVKVVEVDRARNRLILSERDAAPYVREQKKERLLDELEVGDVRVGRVKSLADFGAFVDVGGADGLVHLTELSWKHITHPRDVLRVGQEVEVEVISVDRSRKRIGLSIKRREEDPWTVVAREYQIGQLVQGTITKLTKFGAFARLVDSPEIEGLIHISELAQQRVNHPRDVVNENDVLTLRVVKIDPEQRRLGLSLKRVDSPEYLEADYTRAMEAPQPEAPASEETFVNDLVDFEAASLKEDERRRSNRKKGKKNRRTGRGDSFDEFGDMEDDSEY